MTCFQGIHLFYSICAVIFSVMFLLIALIVAMNFFESRITSKNKMAKSNSRGEVWFIINKITLQLVFIFLSN
jgi:Na+-transporting methylmalonyl-CoA/oxaloacetate decarboxylase gamma subunit